jgi:hypothetical protein
MFEDLIRQVHDWLIGPGHAFIVGKELIGYTMASVVWLYSRTLKRRLKEQEKAVDSELAHSRTLNERIRRVEAEIEKARKHSVEYWIERAGRSERTDDDIGVELSTTILQEGLARVSNPLRTMCFKLGEQRVVLFGETGEEYQLNEAERLFRIVALMNPGDRKAADWLHEIEELIVSNKFQAAGYEPDDPRLSGNPAKEAVTFVDQEDVIRHLSEQELIARNSGCRLIAERLLNRARLIEGTAPDSRDAGQ